MKLVVSVFLFALIQAMATPALADKILRLDITVDDTNVEIRALDHASMPPHVAPVASVSRLNSIYFSLECSVSSECSNLKAPNEPEPENVNPEDIVPILKAEGETLLGPFAGLIRAADEVRFRIDWALLKIPFDLLYLGDEPVFVSKKISFIVGNPRPKTLRTPSQNWVGLLVSDETADPDRAIFGIEKLFPKSQSFDIADFGLSSLQDMKPVDFVAISAHGHVDGAGDGFIAIGDKQRLQSNSLVKLRPKLVYFDSCNLGLSVTHLMELQASGTTYAVAPILSNEAGDSSTGTIEIFFSELAKGIDPVKALFSARSALYERYALDDIQTALWRSFPFRVYRLN